MNEPFQHRDDLTVAGAVAGAVSAAVTLVASDTASRDRALRAFAEADIVVASQHLIGESSVDELGKGPLWVEIGRDDGKTLDRWLMAFNALTDHANSNATLVMTRDLIDVVAAQIDDRHEMLVAPGALERAAAMTLLSVRSGTSGAMVRDKGGNDDSRQLRQLSDEVARIAATLSRLSAEGKSEGLGAGAPVRGASDAVSAPVADGIPDISADVVRGTIRARRLREKFFEASYFADPAWDMLLDLLAAEIAQHRVPVSSLCIAAEVPPTTALRWMKTLSDAGLFRRRSDPHDGRRVFVELSPEASLAMRRYFAALDGQIAA